jgi:hypothetical protein
MNNKDLIYQDTKFALYENHPDKEGIDWFHIDKSEYLEMEKEFCEDAIFFQPLLIENFYSDEEFLELKSFISGLNLNSIAYTKQMNKWEDSINLPQKFIDIAIQKVKEILNTDDIELGYYLYAHHQMTKDGRQPFLQVHLDWSPGTYMVDLHVGGNREWSIVAHDEEFITKENQAVLVQPEFDFHYREPWASQDPEIYYQALFFHLSRKNHWHKKYGMEYQQSDKFLKFQKQRLYMFEDLYLNMIDQNQELPEYVIGNDIGLSEEDKGLLGVDVK